MQMAPFQLRHDRCDIVVSRRVFILFVSARWLEFLRLCGSREGLIRFFKAGITVSDSGRRPLAGALQ